MEYIEVFLIEVAYGLLMVLLGIKIHKDIIRHYKKK
jgi:hypothetical protein